MRNILLAAAALTTLWVIPAKADVSARYEMADRSVPMDMTMTVEVSDAGHVRLQMANLPAYYLLRDGVLYSVQHGFEGPVVIRIEDHLQLQTEFAGQIFGPDVPEQMESPDWKFAAMGEEVVNGRIGTAYGIVPEDGGDPTHALLVIGNQPELASLGEAIQRTNQGMIRSVPQFFAVIARANEEMHAIVGSGAPLRMSGLALTDVSTDPIPDDRFALPAEPLTIEQLRSQLVPFDSPPTLPPRDR